jgi:hypothetical protein
MPRYFFHFGDTDAGLDIRGQELADDNTARIEAVRLLGEILKDKAGEFWDEQSMKLIITDHSGLMLFVLDVSAIEAPALSRRRTGPRPVE